MDLSADQATTKLRGTKGGKLAAGCGDKCGTWGNAEAEEAVCTDHPSRTDWLQCQLTVKATAKGDPNQLDQFRETMGTILGVPKERILFVGFNDNGAVFALSAPNYVPKEGEEVQPTDDDDGFPVWAIIVIAVGGLLVIVGAVAFIVHRKQGPTLSLAQQIEELQSIEAEKSAHAAAGQGL